MKKNLLGILTALLVFTLFNSCKKDEDEPADEVKDNYKIEIINNSDNGVQFTYITLTGLETGVSTISKVFVSNPGQYSNIYITVPKAAFYKVNVYTQKDQTSVWWNSIMLDPAGYGQIYLQEDLNDTFLASTFNNIFADDTDIP